MYVYYILRYEGFGIITECTTAVLKSFHISVDNFLEWTWRSHIITILRTRHMPIFYVALMQEIESKFNKNMATIHYVRQVVSCAIMPSALFCTCIYLTWCLLHTVWCDQSLQPRYSGRVWVTILACCIPTICCDSSYCQGILITRTFETYWLSFAGLEESYWTG